MFKIQLESINLCCHIKIHDDPKSQTLLNVLLNHSNTFFPGISYRNYCPTQSYIPMILMGIGGCGIFQWLCLVLRSVFQVCIGDTQGTEDGHGQAAEDGNCQGGVKCCSYLFAIIIFILEIIGALALLLFVVLCKYIIY